jgi:uncharacterized membrane protein
LPRSIIVFTLLSLVIGFGSLSFAALTAVGFIAIVRVFQQQILLVDIGHCLQL